MTDTKSKRTVVHLLVIVAAVLGAVLLAHWYTSVRLATYTDIAQDVVFEQETQLRARLAELRTSNQPGDEVVVSDCGAVPRARFDELLGRLSTLSRSELTELDTLFGGCAYYFSTLESVKAAQLAREVAVYKDQLRSLAQLDANAAEKLGQLEVWFSVAEQARTQARLSTELVSVQSAIVDLLLAYKPVSSPEVQALVAQGQEIRQNIVFTDQQIETLKTQLYGS